MPVVVSSSTIWTVVRRGLLVSVLVAAAFACGSTGLSVDEPDRSAASNVLSPSPGPTTVGSPDAAAATDDNAAASTTGDNATDRTQHGRPVLRITGAYTESAGALVNALLSYMDRSFVFPDTFQLVFENTRRADDADEDNVDPHRLPSQVSKTYTPSARRLAYGRRGGGSITFAPKSYGYDTTPLGEDWSARPPTSGEPNVPVRGRTAASGDGSDALPFSSSSSSSSTAAASTWASAIEPRRRRRRQLRPVYVRSASPTLDQDPAQPALSPLFYEDDDERTAAEEAEDVAEASTDVVSAALAQQNRQNQRLLNALAVLQQANQAAAATAAVPVTPVSSSRRRPALGGQVALPAVATPLAPSSVLTAAAPLYVVPSSSLSPIAPASIAATAAVAPSSARRGSSSSSPVSTAVNTPGLSNPPPTATAAPNVPLPKFGLPSSQHDRRPDDLSGPAGLPAGLPVPSAGSSNISSSPVAKNIVGDNNDACPCQKLYEEQFNKLTAMLLAQPHKPGNGSVVALPTPMDGSSAPSPRDPLSASAAVAAAAPADRRLFDRVGNGTGIVAPVGGEGACPPDSSAAARHDDEQLLRRIAAIVNETVDAAVAAAVQRALLAHANTTAAAASPPPTNVSATTSGDSAAPANSADSTTFDSAAKENREDNDREDASGKRSPAPRKTSEPDTDEHQRYLIEDVVVRVAVPRRAGPNAPARIVELTPDLLAHKMRAIVDRQPSGKGLVSVCYHNEPQRFGDKYTLAPRDPEGLRAVFNGTMDAVHNPTKGVDLDTDNYLNALITELKSVRRDMVSLCVESSDQNAEFQNAAECMNLLIGPRKKPTAATTPAPPTPAA